MSLLSRTKLIIVSELFPELLKAMVEVLILTLAASGLLAVGH
jgi:hypothetical protein